MSQEISVELLKFRVPLSQAWEEASSKLIECADRRSVEELTFQQATLLESKFVDPCFSEEVDRELLSAVREQAIASVQSRFSGSLPDLPERDSDLLSQHTSLWSLISQLIKKSSGPFSLHKEVLSHAISVLSNVAGSDWKHRARNILNALASFKGTTNEEIKNLCLSDVFLCERELVIPAIKLLTRGSEFKKIMSAPDMISEGDQTLPKLLVQMGNDKEFRQTFMWLPLDPESPLNVSGGSGMMPTDKDDYRFVLRIILKILFGKLRQRGNGIDKRISFAERQGQIMSYIGTVPIAEMGIVFSVLLGRIVNDNVNLESLQPEWNGSEFVDRHSGLAILSRKFLEENPNVRMGILQSMNHLISQMKRKIDSFVPLLAVVVVSCLAWDLKDTHQKSPAKIPLLRLAELMEIYVQVPASVWESLLEPIVDVLKHHLGKSSAAETSTAFRIVTNWSHSEQLSKLYSSETVGKPLLTELLKPRALSGPPAIALFNMILALCGDAAEPESVSAQSYMQSRKQLFREHKRTGGDMDSDSEDEPMSEAQTTEAPMSDNINVVVDHVASILSIVSLSLGKASDKSLPLRVTVTIAKLASSRSIALPEESCGSLLELVSDQLKHISNLPPRKARLAARETCMLLEASSRVSSLVSAQAIPTNLMPTASRLVLFMDDIRGRNLLSECLLELARKVSQSEVKAVEKLVELNSVRQSGVSLQPDVDRHVDILQDILDSQQDGDLEYFLSSVLMIRHCLFLISSVACDTTVRHCAERFLAQTGIVRDEHNRLPIPRLLMIVSQLHKLLEAHSSESTHRSALKLIIGFAKDYAGQLDENDENGRLLHRDLLPLTKSLSSEGGPSVLDDLQHIQKHRRTRALGRLANTASELSDYTRRKLLAPLAIEGIVQPGVAKSAFDASLAETGIKTLQVCPNIVDLLVKLAKVFLRKFEERDKIIFKAISKVAENLRVTEAVLPAEEVARAQGVLVQVLRKRVFDAKGSLKGSTLIGDESAKHKLAREKSRDDEKGIVKLEAVVALLDVLKCFCSGTLADQTEHLVRIVLQGLPSRELINRRAAREALRRCAKVLGMSRLAWLMKEIRHALPRGGFQAAVAVFTCFSVVESIAAEPSTEWGTGNATEIALEVLECVRLEDAQWAMKQSRTDGAVEEEVELSNQCIEAKRKKAHELLELSSKILPASTVTGVMLRSVYSLFNTIEGVEVNDSSSESEAEHRESSHDSSSESDGDARKKRKKPATRSFRGKISKANEIQMNAVHQSKKYMMRIEAALASVLQGIRENSYYTSEDRLGLIIQALAQFNDISSKKFRVGDDSLFSKNGFPRQLLDMDEVGESNEGTTNKRQRVLPSVDFRQKQKEKTFLVQPGASTGRGHWVTEEWKRGKINQTSTATKQVGVLDLRATKSRVLGAMGLRLLNALPSMDLGKLDSEIKTGLAKFVSRAFCSGIAELFQPAAKGIQKLLSVDERIFNAKAMTLIARRLMASMEQLHQSGSDLSFITQKQQRKSPSAEIASTCCSLLLGIVSVEENRDEWLKPDMLETLVSHIRASLDKPALQLASLALLRKLFFMENKQFKSASLYDCLNTVGNLIVTATNPRVCGLSGTLYAQFLVDYPHTEKALSTKLLGLIKQSNSASSAVSRCTALNTIYSFVRALPSKTLQDVFGEIIFVTLAVNVAMEEDATARDMTHKVLVSIVERFVDKTKRDRLIKVVTGWPVTMTKHQFVLGSVEVSSILAGSQLVDSETALEVVTSVIRQLPYLIVPDSTDSGVLQVKSQVLAVQAIGRLIRVSQPSADLIRLLEFACVHLLKKSDPEYTPVIIEVLKFLLSVAGSGKRDSIFIEVDDNQVDSLKIYDDQSIESLAPWPTLMRVLSVLTRNTTETNLEIPSLAMRTVASLLTLAQNVKKAVTETPIVTESEDNEEGMALDDSALGLFARKTDAGQKIVEDSDISIQASGLVNDRLVALLRKIRYEVRGLMAKPRESVIRLASLLKLTAALTLSAPASEDEELLGTSLDILIRLATINKTAEEVSTEIGEVNSLFELSILRPIEQIGCLSKMANGALESIEKHFREYAGFFTRQLTKTTAVINKSRKDRKISLLNLAVSNPARLAMLRLRKSKRKTEKKQERAKETVKRIKGLIN
jgi:hypothetical protein